MAQITPTDDQKQKASPLFIELNKFLTIRDYKQALKVTNKLLHSDGFRQNIKLSKAKCSALIKMNRYDEVVKFIDSLKGYSYQENISLSDALAYEKAYSLYRLFKNDQALEALNNSMINTEQEMNKTNELRAQILYRLEKFNQAKELYKSLLKNENDDFTEDRETNLLACEAALAIKSNAKVKMSKLPAASPDAFFNRSIIHISNKDYARAEKALNSAKTETEAYDDLEPDELEQELTPIFIQLALVDQLKENNKVAIKNYQKILRTEPDLLYTAIINNNILAINQNSNLFDSKKKVRTLQTKNDLLIKKLQSTQLLTMELNTILVLISSGKFNAAIEMINLVKSYPMFQKISTGSENSTKIEFLIAEIFCLLKQNENERAIKLLNEEITQLSKNSDSKKEQQNLKLLNLAMAQISYENAKLEDLEHFPGILKLNLDKTEEIDVKLGYLEKAYDYWSKIVSKPKFSENDENVLNEISKIYGALSLSKNTENSNKVAFKIYQKLSETDESFLPKFIQIASKVEPEIGKLASNKLESAEKLVQGINVQELEENATYAGIKYTKKRQDQNLDQQTEQKDEKKKKKKKRKPKLPKNLKSVENIDEQRWLPLRDRTYYRGGRRTNRNKYGKMVGNQGISGSYAKDAVVLDASSTAFKGNTGSNSNASKSNKKGKKKRR